MNGIALRETRPNHWHFFDPETIPWTPWAMPGTYFKLLNINEANGRFTFLLKVDPGTVAPIHKHLGEGEAFILEGSFGYGDEVGVAGHYSHESAGSLHIPHSPDGLVMFAISHGPIAGFAPDGALAGLIDVDWMYETAKQNGAADHITRHTQFETL
jgi:2,4'-dihydroxyacetophenone dioxygenase